MLVPPIAKILTKMYICVYTGEHQMELLDCVAAKFHEEPGVFKLLVMIFYIANVLSLSDCTDC